MSSDTPARTRLLKLFLSTMYISAFTFGGGFVIITFMKRKFVDQLKWLDEEEMLDLAAIAQSAPGAIAVNAAILVGWRMAGFAGMVTAVFGTILPPMVLLTAISLCYDAFATNPCVEIVLQSMQAGVAAVIFDAVLSLGTNVVKQRSPLYIMVMTSAFAATFFLKINVMLIILAAAATGILSELWKWKRGVRV